MFSWMKRISVVMTGNEFSSTEETKSKTVADKIFSYLFFFIFVIIGLGNWTDSKALFLEAYDGFITHFTNNLEEELVDKIHVGTHLSYVNQLLTAPKLVKKSSLSANVEYRYYKTKKYLLTLISQNQRVSAVVVHSLNHKTKWIDVFSPLIPFTEQYLVKVTISKAVSSNEYYFDNHNLVYFMQTKSLGAEGMYLFLTVGFTELENNALFLSDTRSNLAQLEKMLVLSSSSGKQEENIIKQLAEQKMSFFAISDMTSDFIADSLLTRYEFSAYF